MKKGIIVILSCALIAIIFCSCSNTLKNRSDINGLQSQSISSTTNSGDNSRTTANNSNTQISSTMSSSSKSDSNSSHYKLQNIIGSLHLDKNSYAVSHDSKKIAYVTCTTAADSSTDTFLFIISVEDNKTVQITDFDHKSILQRLSWSYDDKYLSMDNGTDVVFRTFIFDTSTFKKCYEVNSLMGSAWSYSSNSIAYSAVNQKVSLSNQDTELGFSTDVVIYNMNTKISRTVFNANPKYYYDLLVWNKTCLSVQRNFLPEGKETVKLNITE